MPLDLIGGIVGITALSVLSYLVGRQINSRQRSDLPVRFILSLLIALVFAWSFSGKLGWATIVPDASVVSWSNLMPVLLALTAGFATGAPRLTPLQRSVTIASLVMLAIAYAVTPVARPLVAPALVPDGSTWRGDICLQSHPSTCAPAAAATLLRLSGIAVSEKTMAKACLTSRQGTEPLGLYHGLSGVSDKFGVQARVASSNPDHWHRYGHLPNIALVRFAETKQRHALQRLLGPRGEGHAIVILNRQDNGDWTIADPAFGQTTWTDQQLKARFTGDAIYLERAPLSPVRTKRNFESAH